TDQAGGVVLGHERRARGRGHRRCVVPSSRAVDRTSVRPDRRIGWISDCERSSDLWLPCAKRGPSLDDSCESCLLCDRRSAGTSGCPRAHASRNSCITSETGVRVQFFCDIPTVCARKARKKPYSDRRFWRANCGMAVPPREPCATCGSDSGTPLMLSNLLEHDPARTVRGQLYCCNDPIRIAVSQPAGFGN